jgi:hypothetical protein
MQSVLVGKICRKTNVSSYTINRSLDIWTSTTITDPDRWQSHLNPWNRTWSTTKFWKAYQKQWRPRYNSCWKKWTSFLLFLGVFGEYSLIGDGLCCRLRDLGVLLVWVMYFQRSSWPCTLHKPTRRRFLRRRVVVYGIDHQWQADLVDLAKLSSYNKGFKY